VTPPPHHQRHHNGNQGHCDGQPAPPPHPRADDRHGQGGAPVGHRGFPHHNHGFDQQPHRHEHHRDRGQRFQDRRQRAADLVHQPHHNRDRTAGQHKGSECLSVHRRSPALGTNSNASMPAHRAQRVSPGNSRANRRHRAHRVRVTPTSAGARHGSNLFTVYLRVDSAGAEMVGRPWDSASAPTRSTPRIRACVIATRPRACFVYFGSTSSTNTST
jgi:hypothetical protein